MATEPIEKIITRLSDNSYLQITGSAAGVLYLSVVIPGPWKDGKETASTRSSAILSVPQARQLRAMLNKVVL